MKKVFLGALIVLLVGAAFAWANTVEKAATKPAVQQPTDMQYYDASDLTSSDVPAGFVLHHAPTGISMTRTVAPELTGNNAGAALTRDKNEPQLKSIDPSHYVPYTPGTVLDAPANDECSSCEAVTFPSTVSGTTVEATVDCPGLFTNDYAMVWYCVSVPYTLNNITVDFCPTYTDLNDSVYTIFPYLFSDCACAAENVIGYNNFAFNAGCYYQPLYDFLYLPGPATYYLPVYVLDYDLQPMAFEFDISVEEATPQEQGDACDNPFIIGSLPYTDDTHNSGDFNNDYEFDGGYGNLLGPDVVYELTLTECMDVTVSLCNTDPMFDTYLLIYPGDDCGGTPIFGDDDYCGAYGTSQISATLGPCTYYIVVDAYSGQSGPYVLDVTGTVCSPVPANDDFANAEDVGTTFPVTVSGTTYGANIDCPGFLDWNGVWYSFVAPNDFNDVSISFCPTEDDLPTAGIVLMDDGNCDDYIIADAASFVDCDNGSVNVEMSFYGLPGGTYYYVAYTGCVPYDFSFTIDVREQCELTCPPTATPEGETICYDGYTDDYNSGCNFEGAPPAPTTPIADGDTICGNAGHHLDAADQPVRDTDWYLFDLGTELRTFEWTGVANFPLQLLIIDAYTDCSQTPILASGTADPCETLTVSVTGTGLYYLWAGPTNDISVDCATGTYVSWVYVVPPPSNDAAVVSVDSPQYYRVPANSTSDIKASVTNFGVDPYTFDVTATIVGDVSGPLYSSTRTATNVTNADTVILQFDDFTSDCLENYTLDVTANGVGDENPDNDNLTYDFASHAFGFDGYVDGTTYWVYGLDGWPSWAVRFHVPTGYTADLSAGLMYFYSFGAQDANITPWLAYTDANDNPDIANQFWTGATQYVGPAAGAYPVQFDLSSVANQTQDFWVGFTATAGSNAFANIYGEGQLSVENAPDNNRMTDGATWYRLDDVWLNPTDVWIFCDYDLTGGTYEDGAATEVVSPAPAVIGLGPHEVIVTYENLGLVDITGATANVTVTGPGGVEFTGSESVDITVVDGSAQVDFGSWTASTGGVSYDIEASITTATNDDVCNDVVTSQCFVIAGTEAYFQNFDTDDGGFTEVIHSGPTIWQWGTDATTGSVSPPNVWGTILNGDYPINACASLVSPSLTVPAHGGALVVSVWYDLEAPGDPWDFCNVKISTDGSRYYVLTPYGGYPYVDQYPGNLCATNSLQAGFCGNSNGWKQKAWDLTPYSGQNVWISFDFASDGAVVYHGFYLDNFTIVEYEAPACLEYLPGDANMYNGSWPPQVIGSDVTYLVNYFRALPTNPSCLVGGNYAAADVNGSCSIIGSDVTRLVNYFRGSGLIETCPDWEPCWHNSGELPPSAPAGWPNCETPMVTKTVPGSSSSK